MKRPAATRIATNAPATSGINPAFAGLQMDALPPGPEQPAAAPVDPGWKMGRVVLQRETAHRGGKTVVVVQDFATHLPATVIEKIAKKLRAACGCGGTVKDRRIEIQGDQVAKIRSLLEAEGFQVAGVR
ncbi:MAG TPA: translation initiation factor [Chthoniobacterales bacterium]|jgi:translation initiation factor 1